MSMPKIKQHESVKDAVIAILAVTWPMRTKELYPLVQKKGFQVTYQAVHKSIKELADVNVLVGDRHGYKLNKTWINRLAGFVRGVQKSYRRKNGR